MIKIRPLSPHLLFAVFILIAEATLAGTTSRAARARTPSRSPIIVAIIDTGVDLSHKVLRSHLWTNPGESGIDTRGLNKSKNQIDDDKNGFVDDVHGWDFTHNSNDLSDHHGHGTHIAGIIAGEARGSTTTTDSAPIQIMILKYCDPVSEPDTSSAAKIQDDPLKNTVQAIDYAIKMKAHIINYSSGGLVASDEESIAVKETDIHNILFVAAAGNEGLNSDVHGYFPAGYGYSNILSVTANDDSHHVLPTSNFGARSVAVAATGKDIISTLNQNSRGAMTGTSQATAFATGAAARMMARFPRLIHHPQLVRERLIKTGDEFTPLLGKTNLGTEINESHALTMQPSSTTLMGDPEAMMEGTWDEWFVYGLSIP